MQCKTCVPVLVCVSESSDVAIGSFRLPGTRGLSLQQCWTASSLRLLLQPGQGAEQLPDRRPGCPRLLLLHRGLAGEESTAPFSCCHTLSVRATGLAPVYTGRGERLELTHPVTTWLNSSRRSHSEWGANGGRGRCGGVEIRLPGPARLALSLTTG